VEETYDRARYVLVVRLPRQVEVRIEDAYLALAGTTKPVMGYHISLLGPFHVPDEADSQFLANIGAVCRRWQPFHLHIAGLGAFIARDDNVVYLHVADPDNIMALHRDLLEATRGQLIPQSDRDREWSFERYHPHVTLGLRLSDRELQQFLPMALGSELGETFQVTCISLAEQTPHGPWHYMIEYPLGSPAPGAAPDPPCASDRDLLA